MLMLGCNSDALGGLRQWKKATPAPNAKQFTELFNLHYPKVLAYARRRLRPEVSDDAVADTFLSV